MKLHMVSIIIHGQLVTVFVNFPAGVKPYITEKMLSTLGMERNQAFGVGGNPYLVWRNVA